jgi:hypothetical protein
MTIPHCGINPGTDTGTFARLPSGFSADPTPGGGAKVLTYILPFTISNTTNDVLMSGTIFADPDGDFDLLRFVGNRLFFYSAQSVTGTGSCATGLPNNATGCDGVADVAQEPFPPQKSTLVVQEFGEPGNTEGLYGTSSTLGVVEFAFQSDEVTKCPANVPNCGPMNIAPPPDDPYRDITGLTAPMMLVNIPLPGGDPFDPFVLTPEPASIWLLPVGAAILLLLRRRLTRPLSRGRHPGLL